MIGIPNVTRGLRLLHTLYLHAICSMTKRTYQTCGIWHWTEARSERQVLRGLCVRKGSVCRRLSAIIYVYIRIPYTSSSFPLLSRKHFQVRPERPAGNLFCCCRPHLCLGHPNNLPALKENLSITRFLLAKVDEYYTAPNSEQVWTSNLPWSFLGRLPWSANECICWYLL